MSVDLIAPKPDKSQAHYPSPSQVITPERVRPGDVNDKINICVLKFTHCGSTTPTVSANTQERFLKDALTITKLFISQKVVREW